MTSEMAKFRASIPAARRLPSALLNVALSILPLFLLPVPVFANSLKMGGGPQRSLLPWSQVAEFTEPMVEADAGQEIKESEPTSLECEHANPLIQPDEM
jgi:hypothetical protein